MEVAAAGAAATVDLAAGVDAAVAEVASAVVEELRRVE